MYASLAVAAITVVTFGLALLAVPISGANCSGDCLGYPYLDTLDRFPRDYIWMYAAMVLLIAYLVFVLSLRAVLLPRGAVLADVTAAVAVASTVVLVPTYFVQALVVPASLAAGETEGITLLTQYNPHGVFIALEEVGYLLMSVSFLAMVPLLKMDGMRTRVIRWLFAGAFVVPVLALIAYSAAYGLDRMDRFEVVVISVDWLVLIINGVLIARLLRDRIRRTASAGRSA
jgi:hypothetical protein